jgi:leader peptidase (prepilin peptidase)/N-methyltransferase
LLVEVATGLLFGLAVWRLDDERSLLPAVLVLFTGLVATSTVDLLCSRIPTRFVYLTAAAVAVAAVPRLVDEPRSWVGAAVGGGLCLVGLGLLHLASPAMLGFGDVRLGGLIGAVVGWVGWTEAEPVFEPISRVVQVVFLAGVLGTVAGVALLVVRRANQAYPFGPCLAFGAVVTLLATP